MKVVHEVTDANAIIRPILPKEVRCSGCTSTLSVFLGDLVAKTVREEDFRGDEYNVQHLFFMCPVCGTNQRLMLKYDETAKVLKAMSVAHMLGRRKKE